MMAFPRGPCGERRMIGCDRHVDSRAENGWANAEIDACAVPAQPGMLEELARAGIGLDSPPARKKARSGGGTR
jgi:hypothetical protein